MDGTTRLSWKPEMDRIQRVILKNARGHAYFEYGEPMLDSPASVWALPLERMSKEERREFEAPNARDNVTALPEVGSRMLQRVFTGEDMEGPWIVVQAGIYRYSVEADGGFRVRSILCEYLATEVQWLH